MTNSLIALGKYPKREEKLCRLHKLTLVSKLKSLSTRTNGCDPNLSRLVLHTRVSRACLRAWAQIPTQYLLLRLQSSLRDNRGSSNELSKTLLFSDNIYLNNIQIASFPLFQSSRRIKITKIKTFYASLATLL